MHRNEMNSSSSSSSLSSSSSRTNFPSHFRLEDLIRPNILNLKPYRCARDDYDRGILLDANENSLGSSLSPVDRNQGIDSKSKVEASLSIDNHKLDLSNLTLHRYPSPVNLPIKQNLCNYRNLYSDQSDLKQLEPSNVFLGVGSDEILDLLFRITCKPGHADGSGDRVIVTPPTYGMYSVCAQVNDVGLIKVPLITRGGAFTLDLDQINLQINHSSSSSIKLIILCSPGNPTGTTIPIESMIKILLNPNFKGLLVVDEAYIDFTDQSKSSLQLVRKGWKNLIVVQTLSKAFGLAGIRLGAAYGSEELIQILNNTKAPYSISSPTSTLAYTATLPEFLIKSSSNIEEIKRNREWLISKLKGLKDMGDILGSNEANFVLIQVRGYGSDLPDSNRAKKVYNHMARLDEPEAIVVRYRGDDFGCEGCLRITVGSKEDCEKVVERLKQTLELEL
ncbi:pyridoxal phosphate-dependent transferase [Phakopsora pachyrhizi]|uniref:histidinol-phosphate transaminase n=1 Tax=Phakopsora pachyrhizi TaxID=170000 RepID=A0AAV0BNF2_PHAPC|nr:pyridoxal phosphate-dependent transferase [Phakopsora pachyrhizi]